jgi:hypothetical protein
VAFPPSGYPTRTACSNVNPVAYNLCDTSIDLAYCHYSFTFHLNTLWSTQQHSLLPPQRCFSLYHAVPAVSIRRTPRSSKSMPRTTIASSQNQTIHLYVFNLRQLSLADVLTSSSNSMHHGAAIARICSQHSKKQQRTLPAL